MQRLQFFSLIIFTGLATSAFAVTNNCNNGDFKNIMQQKQRMAQCWNKGDLACVVNKFYAPHFVYMGDTQLITTKKQLLTHYLTNFGNKEKLTQLNLGQLHLKAIYCRKLSQQHFFTILQYKLIDKQHVDYGYDLTIWQKSKTGYQIITDFPRASS